MPHSMYRDLSGLCGFGDSKTKNRRTKVYNSEDSQSSRFKVPRPSSLYLFQDLSLQEGQIGSFSGGNWDTAAPSRGCTLTRPAPLFLGDSRKESSPSLRLWFSQCCAWRWVKKYLVGIAPPSCIQSAPSLQGGVTFHVSTTSLQSQGSTCPTPFAWHPLALPWKMIPNLACSGGSV